MLQITSTCTTAYSLKPPKSFGTAHKIMHDLGRIGLKGVYFINEQCKLLADSHVNIINSKGLDISNCARHFSTWIKMTGPINLWARYPLHEPVSSWSFFHITVNVLVCACGCQAITVAVHSPRPQVWNGPLPSRTHARVGTSRQEFWALTILVFVLDVKVEILQAVAFLRVLCAL